ncbi:hypothetical protein [Streptomyces sp. DSM 40907]|uniref:hypothetical protein n=1 Tax=Streptomyces kutzneri TaxID=3051179 RepID=UPI0028D64B37|nr:hypothetical protein [Streptomyces sp. DSM 40907]
MSHRVHVPHILGVVLALSLTACGSAEDKAPDVKNPAAAGRTAGGSGPGTCPDKHAATVADDKFGGTADIDLCALPDVHQTAVVAAWIKVYDRPAGAPLNIMPVTCTGESTGNCTEIKAGDTDLCNQAKPNCHPQRGEEVPVVCSAKDPLAPTTQWYGVLLDSKRLLAMGTGHDRSFTKDFTDKGDLSVGYVDAKGLDQVSGRLPACDGSMLHGSGARTLAQMQGLSLG